MITCLIVGLSHVVQRQAWADTLAAMNRLGKPGAFINGGLSLIFGAAVTATHPVWSGPALVLTVFGWLAVLKGALYFVAPNLALRAMEKAAAGDSRKIAAAGLIFMAVGVVLAYVVCRVP